VSSSTELGLLPLVPLTLQTKVPLTIVTHRWSKTDGLVVERDGLNS